MNNKINYSLALQKIEFLAWAFLLITFALKIFGIDTSTPTISNDNVLGIINFVNDNIPLRIAYQTISGIVICNIMYFYLLYDLPIKINRKLIAFNAVILIYQIVQNISHFYITNSKIITILGVLGFLIIYLFVRKPKAIIRLIIYDTILVFISAIVTEMNIQIAEKDFLNIFFISIDYYVMWFIALIRIKRGVTWLFYVDLALDCFQRKLQNCKQGVINIKRHTILLKTHLKDNGLWSVFAHVMIELRLYMRHSLKLLIKYRILPITLVFGTYLAFAIITDKLLEAVFLYIAYIYLRGLFPKHFHADYIPNIKKELISITCICLSAFMLCMALHNVVGGGLSVISSVLVAFALDYVLFILRDWLDLSLENPKLKATITPEIELKAKLANTNLTDMQRQICIDWKIYKHTRKRQAEAHGIGVESIRYHRNVISEALTNNNIVI